MLLSLLVVSLSEAGLAWLAPSSSLLQRPQNRGLHHRWQSESESESVRVPYYPSPITSLYYAKRSGNNDDAAPKPPVPFRDETSFILAGELPADTSAEEEDGASSPPPLRQSISSTNSLLSPPRKIPNPYGWMRDDTRTNQTVLDHLHAENEYGKKVTAHLGDLRETLYQEFLDTIQQTDYTTPSLKTIKDGKNYWYYTRFEEGESYPCYCRAPQANKDELYPPPVNEGWDKKIIVNSETNETALSPLLPGEEIYLDVPVMARNKTYFAVGAIALSPNQEYLAYSLDEKGGETCQLYVKHIASGKVWVINDHTDNEGEVEPLECDGSVVWNNENNMLYYKIMDKMKRPYRLYRRQIFDSDGEWIGDVQTQKEGDELLLEEKDELFSLGISKTFDGRYLNARSTSKESSEVHYLDLSPDEDVKDNNKFVCIAKRQPGVLYRVTYCHGYWLVLTNIGGLPNLSLKACRVGDEGMEHWKDVVSIDTDEPIFSGGHERSLDGVTIFNPQPDEEGSPLAYAIITGREDGMPRVWIVHLNEELSTDAREDSSSLVASQITRLEFEEDAYDVGIGGVRDPSLPYIVIAYDSLVTPPSHIAIPLSDPINLDARRVLKEKEIPGYEKESYACERTTVCSRDGKTEIPVSLVYHREILEEKSSGGIATHLYGYGSYGASCEASFRGTRLPLLKRKVVYALAHVRGGGELGRPWYDSAKYLTKMNTFNDFVDVARWLVDDDASTGADISKTSIGKGLTIPSKLSCEGRSAGGLLIGASINQQPELFQAAILGVPFVDVACTMTDASIPLTVPEWEEWGNPNEDKYFDYMMSYCPINNIQQDRAYPSCLITGGLHDPRVQYWEPGKYAAELRHRTSEESGKVIVKMDMDSGHFSASDRYKYLRELAFDYAFLLNELGNS